MQQVALVPLVSDVDIAYKPAEHGRYAHCVGLARVGSAWISTAFGAGQCR